MPLTSPYTDNATKQAINSIVGFKISKPGFDATKTAGSNLIFNSSWPSLPIAYEVNVVGTGSLQTIAHNLKFPPFTMAWKYIADPSGVGNVGVRFMPMFNSTNVYINVPLNTKVKIRCFQLDVSLDRDYVLAVGDSFQSAYDPNFGIKVVKPNKDINSKDLRDFSVHSRAQSPLIAAIKTEQTIPTANLATGIGNVIQYTSKYKSAVWVYGYIKTGTTYAGILGVPVNTYVNAPYYNQGYPRTFTDGFKAYIGYTSGANADNGASLIILRDPMFAATQTTVQY